MLGGRREADDAQHDDDTRAAKRRRGLAHGWEAAECSRGEQQCSPRCGAISRRVQALATPLARAACDGENWSIGTCSAQRRSKCYGKHRELSSVL